MIGRAAAPALARDGWDVVVVSRSGSLPDGFAELGIEAAQADRDDDAQLRAAIGGGADVVVDIVARGRDHGAQLNALDAGALIVISTASVYADDRGLAFDGEEHDHPHMPVPIPETQPTAAPGPETYSTNKAALEQEVLGGPLPATVLRPCAIHGPGAQNPRELIFVQRAVDDRRRVAIAQRGQSRFHTTSVANLAELIRLAAAAPDDRVLNAGDPETPTTLEICHAIGAALHYDFEPVLLPGSEYPNPWGVEPDKPLVVSMDAAARELGYAPVTTYPEAVTETCAWLVSELESGRNWDESYLAGMLDYEAEDAAIASAS
jgi:nucleoside-diphosphate-sugar epimerase